MDNISGINTSRQNMLRSMMDITANNIANMTTPGFMAQNMLFKEMVQKTDERGGGGKISSVGSNGSYRDLSQGQFTQTHNPLDAAIDGEGYFVVDTPDGTRYTRTGNFSLDNTGALVTKDKYKVQGEGGPINIPQGATNIQINKDGTINTDKGSAGKLKLVKFQDEQGIQYIGGNLYSVEDQQAQPVAKPHIEQGMLEGSNVNPIFEMNKMIELLRTYQSTQNIINTDHDMMLNTIDKLTRV